MTKLIYIIYGEVLCKDLPEILDYDFKIRNTDVYIKTISIGMFLTFSNFKNKLVGDLVSVLPNSIKNDFIYSLLLCNVNIETDILE